MAALLLTAYVVPAERVLDRISELRKGSGPVRMQVSVGTPKEDDKLGASVELHPAGGWRIVDEEGRRWLGTGPRPREVAEPRAPEALAHLWVLLVADGEVLRSYLSALGIDLGRNQLARCGEQDCFVIGGRSAPAQLWVDKDRFEVRRLRTRKGRTFEFEGYREGPHGFRLPYTIRVLDPLGPVSEAGVLGVERAPDLVDSPEIAPSERPLGSVPARPADRRR